jgi:peroxiredoxin
MLKNLKYLGCFLYVFFACSEENTYRIKVDLANLQAQDVYAVFEAADSKMVDTISYAGKGAFVITQKQDDFRTLVLYYDNFSRWITVYLENPQRIVVSGDALFPGLIQVKGGKINELLSEFRKETAGLLRERANLAATNDTIRGRLNGNTTRTARLATINQDLRLQARTFIEKNTDEEASAILIKEYFVNSDNPLLIDNLLDRLNPKLDAFYVVQELKSYTEKAKQTIAGARAPDFNVRNIYGQTFSRDSFANRYFILAFTTMWSDLCQTEEMYLDEIISSFSKDSLNVMLVSLDENPHEVRTIVRTDSIRWNIVTDSIGQAIKLLDLYNVTILPHCFLMDKEGYIVLKTENGAELRRTLQQLLPNEKS